MDTPPLNCIDNVYVINMDRSKDRLANMTEQLKGLGLDFIRVSAIDGKHLRKDDIINVTNSFCGSLCSPSIIGCFLSHKKTWQKVVDNNDKYAMILEDDCKLVDGFDQKLNDAIDELNKIDPEWEFLYGGCFGPCKKNDKATVISHLQKLFLAEIPHREHTGINTFIPLSPVGFHCYIISNTCAQKLLKALHKVSYHVDVEFLKHAENFRVYAMIHKIGYQFSTAENSTLNELKFPRLLNWCLDGIKDNDGISYSYYCGSPLLQLDFFPLTLYFILFIGLLLSIPIFIPRPLFFYYVLLLFLIVELFLNVADVNVISVYIILLIVCIKRD